MQSAEYNKLNFVLEIFLIIRIILGATNLG
jgi:hypothetical protein